MKPICPKCGGSHCIRIKREGFLQTKVLPHLNRFPWECSDCRNTFTNKFRGKPRRRRSSSDQPDSPPQPIPNA